MLVWTERSFHHNNSSQWAAAISKQHHVNVQGHLACGQRSYQTLDVIINREFFFNGMSSSLNQGKLYEGCVFSVLSRNNGACILMNFSKIISEEVLTKIFLTDSSLLSLLLFPYYRYEKIPETKLLSLSCRPRAHNHTLASGR